MRFDRLSLVLLNVLAASRLLPSDPWLTNALAVIFLIRLTIALKDTALVAGGQAALVAEPSTLPAMRS